MTTCRWCASPEEHKLIMRFGRPLEVGARPDSKSPERNRLSEPGRRRTNQNEDLVPGVSRGARADDGGGAEPDDEFLEEMNRRARRTRGERTGGTLDGVPIYRKVVAPPTRYAAGRIDGRRIVVQPRKRKKTIL